MWFNVTATHWDRDGSGRSKWRSKGIARSIVVVISSAVLLSALLSPTTASARSQPAQQPGQTVTRKKSLKYDAVNRVKEQLTQLLDASGKQVSAVRESYDYDGRGNRNGLTVEELDADNATLRSFTETSKFDALSRESEMVHTDFKKGVKAGSGKIAHKYDPVGQETETTQELFDATDHKIKGQKIVRKFDPVGSIIEQSTELSDKDKKTSTLKETMKYNPVRSEIERVTEELDKDDKKLRSVKVTRKYNPLRQEIERTTQMFDAQGNEVSTKTEKIDPAKQSEPDDDPNPAS
jgi:hypothetical protein